MICLNKNSLIQFEGDSWDFPVVKAGTAYRRADQDQHNDQGNCCGVAHYIDLCPRRISSLGFTNYNYGSRQRVPVCLFACELYRCNQPLSCTFERAKRLLSLRLFVASFRWLFSVYIWQSVYSYYLYWKQILTNGGLFLNFYPHSSGLFAQFKR